MAMQDQRTDKIIEAKEILQRRIDFCVSNGKTELEMSVDMMRKLVEVLADVESQERLRKIIQGGH